MPFFIGQWVILIIGWAAHTFFDRHANRRTRARAVELGLLWVMVGGGVWAVLAGFSHIGPYATQTAKQIGYVPSMFQWEVGWADLAIGVLGIGCAWRRRRGSWLTAAVVALAISYGGDAIGHIMQVSKDHNLASTNVWSLRSDLLQVVLAVALLVAYRRTAPATMVAATSSAAPTRPSPSTGPTGSSQPATPPNWPSANPPTNHPSWTVRV